MKIHIFDSKVNSVKLCRCATWLVTKQWMNNLQVFLFAVLDTLFETQPTKFPAKLLIKIHKAARCVVAQKRGSRVGARNALDSLLFVLSLASGPLARAPYRSLALFFFFLGPTRKRRAKEASACESYLSRWLLNLYFVSDKFKTAFHAII